MNDPIHGECILILDFGSQYTQLIARRVRETGVYAEIHPFDLDGKVIRAMNPRGIILSGGHQSVYDPEAPVASPVVWTLGVPILGICYGMQWMAQALGGRVEAAGHREYGAASIRCCGEPGSLLTWFFRDVTAQVWMSHGDRVAALPASFRVLAASDNAPIAAMADEMRQWYGVQFHPEVHHTPNGGAIIEAFTREICHCHGLWTPARFVDYAVSRIQRQVGEGERVLLGLSGGVDSAVAAALIHRAIGDRLVAVFVDNGLLRLHEALEVMATFARHLGVRVVMVAAEERFLSRLRGVSDPEKKRRLIGHTFVELFEEEARKIVNVRWLAQGTIYPDVIESNGAATGVAKAIKSHHNVGGLPEKMGLKLLEPLRELFKDEVRKVGLELGLPRSLLYRHPFPGPGLGVRILGEVTREAADCLRQADAIFLEELHGADLYDQIGQAFAVFLPVKSVGVMGDGRSYENVVALRAVETQDFMTASCYPIPHELLQRIAGRIVNEVAGINRVVYDLTSKPPGTIEWE